MLDTDMRGCTADRNFGIIKAQFLTWTCINYKTINYCISFKFFTDCVSNIFKRYRSKSLAPDVDAFSALAEIGSK